MNQISRKSLYQLRTSSVFYGLITLILTGTIAALDVMFQDSWARESYPLWHGTLPEALVLGLEISCILVGLLIILGRSMKIKWLPVSYATPWFVLAIISLLQVLFIYSTMPQALGGIGGGSGTYSYMVAYNEQLGSNASSWGILAVYIFVLYIAPFTLSTIIALFRMEKG